MIHKIRTSKLSKAIACYLALQLIITTVQPSNLWALTSGPSQPEFNSFTPIGTSDMVNLSSGDFNYNIPIMDVGGYPLNLSYQSGITMDQEASWVGLGWNLNVGQINRQVRGIPDDFKGDQMRYEKNLENHVTVGVNAMFNTQVFGLEPDDFIGGGLGIGLGIKYSNYHGVSFSRSYGLTFDLANAATVGMDVQTSAIDGVTINPRVSAKKNIEFLNGLGISGQLNAGLSYNSSRGLSTFNLQGSLSSQFKNGTENRTSIFAGLGVLSSRLSFSDPFTITPRKRDAFTDTNVTFSFSTGASVFGVDGEIELSATGSVQKIKDNKRKEKAYGYEFTGQATPNDILDYNRENDRIISKNLLALPTTNYTYDLYSVQGQGVSGMFRAHRSHIGHIYDEHVQDESESLSLGGEFEGGVGWHVGANFVKAPTRSHTGVWQTNASNAFKNDNENLTDKDYEPVYFKYVGEHKIDNTSLYTNQLHGDKAMAIKLGGANFNKYADRKFRVKTYDDNNVATDKEYDFSGEFKRKKREVRNQSVQKITKQELKSFYSNPKYFANWQKNNPYAENHHTAEIRILKDNGSTYVFGETAYNVEKHEVAFATNTTTGDCQTGIVKYSFGENTLGNRSGIDHFYDKVITPAYAHTYLISAIYSSDYEDKKGDGPTDDDLGTYTKFEYQSPQEDLYQWRVPFGNQEASYNAGLNTHKRDQKGSYVFGKKEIKYIDKITTKTHIAVFDLSARLDARGVDSINGGMPANNEQQLCKINHIKLYAKPDYQKLQKLLQDNDPNNDDFALAKYTPIKTAYFEYDYLLCQNTPNSSASTGGKLTLTKVYFTYRSSEMGRYTPYKFFYEEDFNADGTIDLNESIDSNPDYVFKDFDVWGNYKPNQGGCAKDDGLTNQEFPFVDQGDKALQDKYVASWTLRSIALPSGGNIAIKYESDDYQYVQDKHTMQMYKVVGVGNIAEPTINPDSNQLLYKAPNFEEATHLYVELPEETSVLDEDEFRAKYLKDQEGKPLYFRFFTNMTKAGATGASTTDFDYVTGYFKLNGNPTTFINSGKVYASIPMQRTDMEGGVNDIKQVNPISKAGWYFGRSYLNGIVYGLNQDANTENVKNVTTIAKSLVSSITSISEIFTGPNGKLRSNRHLCAQRFDPEKSWIRLSTPKNYKLGGGLRVKEVVMTNNWDQMAPGEQIQTYGQTYSYGLENGQGSSGVATFEPNNSAENPFVEPFYDKEGERLVAPRELSYIEKPFGKAFFPAPTVTYSRVTVKNLEHQDITLHATGKVVSEFYTSKDFPTKVDYTDMESYYESNENNVLSQMLKSLVGLPIHVKNKITLSQGFVVHTNDINGKSKSQKVYQEGADKPISSVLYRYNTVKDDDTKLSNTLPVIHKNGTINRNSEIAVDYDVVTDFRESYTNSKTSGINVNVAGIPNVFTLLPPILIIPTAFPTSAKHENTAHSVITTKVVHTTAILKEKIATDLGARVSTVNEAWDANTGQVLLTKTQNEFDDAYYNFNFPAYWNYNTMGQTAQNLDMRGILTPQGNYFTYPKADTYFALGDEIIAQHNQTSERLWVVEFNDSGNGILLMNRNGAVINRSVVQISEPIRFKIVRSGYRNQQMANMAAITMMQHPLKNLSGGNANSINTHTFLQPITATTSKRIINASAISYKDFWNCQCEYKLPSLPYEDPLSDVIAAVPIENYEFNPYLYNAKGDWRADKSYAYLTERTDVKQGTETHKQNTRKQGYFKQFTPFYITSGGSWLPSPNTNKYWTFASEVTQYSPFGVEFENKDALGRHSSAQYGYNFTLPTAVVSNSKYRHMGADNFEDYSFLNTNEAHFSYKEITEQDGEGGITTSIKHAHTGIASLLVDQQNAASLPKELIAFVPDDSDADDDGIKDFEDNCPQISNSHQADYDRDGIGDPCDDEARPVITDVVKSERFWSCGKQMTYTINGTPNKTATIEFRMLKEPKKGHKNVYLNGKEISVDFEVGEPVEITFDATGRYFAEVELWVQKKSKQGSRRTFEISMIILDQYGSFENINFETQSYDFGSSCKEGRGEPIFPRNKE